VAAYLLADELRHAWGLDCGIWGPWVFQVEVARALTSLEGDLVTTELRGAGGVNDPR
jgi:hypothetical protein